MRVLTYCCVQAGVPGCPGGGGGQGPGLETEPGGVQQPAGGGVLSLT